jgi:hypothetical protein
LSPVIPSGAYHPGLETLKKPSGDEIENSIEQHRQQDGSGHFFNYRLTNEKEIKLGFILSFCVTLMARNKISSDVLLFNPPA